MHTRELICQAYENTTAKTLDIWDTCRETGRVRSEPFYHPTRLAITSGNRAGPSVAGLLRELNAVVPGDPLVDIAPLNGMHFTFFAITQALYDKPEDAADLAGLVGIFEQHCAGHMMQIKDLRLVGLPDQLLLAGFPDAESLRVRQALVEHLLSTPWAAKIRARFPNTEIPQIFWHSTLLRYNAQYLPDSLRHWFYQNRQKDFGSLSLLVKLVMTNYNWTETFTLA